MPYHRNEGNSNTGLLKIALNGDFWADCVCNFAIRREPSLSNAIVRPDWHGGCIEGQSAS